MNIGAAAKASGVSAKMIRHYEALGLVPPAGRTESGYRQYSDKDVHMLRFIARARDLGFTMAEIVELLGLWQDRARSSRQVRALAVKHIADLETRVRELQEMKSTLEHLVHCCHGDSRPECPILDALARDEGPAAAPRGGRLQARRRATRAAS